MPIETLQALKWALTQEVTPEISITKHMCHAVVDKVREYFNVNNINYDSFSYDDLVPFIIQLTE
jgi:hypothetical protein